MIFWQFLALLATHWVADFVLQTHWQASNKSKNNAALARHVGTYTAVLAAVSLFLVPLNVWVAFVVVNGALHFATDYCTSRWSSKYFGKDWHTFFVIIGFDQLIHHTTLAVTLWLTHWRPF